MPTSNLEFLFILNKCCNIIYLNKAYPSESETPKEWKHYNLNDFPLLRLMSLIILHFVQLYRTEFNVFNELASVVVNGLLKLL